MYKRILVPLEEEGGSEAHLHHAVALAANAGAEVIPLRVITVVPVDEYFMKRIQIEEGSRGAQKKAAAEDYAARLEQRFQDQGVAVKPEVIVSDRGEDEAIVAYAVESGSDLIVLPNQRRSLVSRWLKGNVTARVQRRSPVPVLFVRGEE